MSLKPGFYGHVERSQLKERMARLDAKACSTAAPGCADQDSQPRAAVPQATPAAKRIAHELRQIIVQVDAGALRTKTDVEQAVLAAVGLKRASSNRRKLVARDGAPAVTWPVPAALDALDYYRADRTLCARWDELLGEWGRAFPGVDLIHETMKSHAWQKSSLARKKSNNVSFLFNWFKRAQQDASQTVRGNHDADRGRARRFDAADQRQPGKYADLD